MDYVLMVPGMKLASVLTADHSENQCGRKSTNYLQRTRRASFFLLLTSRVVATWLPIIAVCTKSWRGMIRFISFSGNNSNKWYYTLKKSQSVISILSNEK